MVFKLKMTGANCVLLCTALFSSSLTAYATEKSADSMADSSASGVVQGKIAVSGTVKDKNGEPLIGVSVVEKGTTNGMITDLDGNFGLSVSSPEAVLEFSYVGYNPVSVKAGDRTFFAIEMGESAQNLDEVVVTALGIKREKKMLGYAVRHQGRQTEHDRRPLGHRSLERQGGWSANEHGRHRFERFDQDYPAR